MIMRDLRPTMEPSRLLRHNRKSKPPIRFSYPYESIFIISKSHWKSAYYILKRTSYLRITILQPDIELGKIFFIYEKPFVRPSFPVLFYPISLQRNSFLDKITLCLLTQCYEYIRRGAARKYFPPTNLSLITGGIRSSCVIYT